MKLQEGIVLMSWDFQCFASGYLSFFFTDCLMSRWYVVHPNTPALQRNHDTDKLYTGSSTILPRRQWSAS